MDYLQEDVDAMQKELQLWRSESRQHAEALQAERRWGPGRGGPVSGRGARVPAAQGERSESPRPLDPRFLTSSPEGNTLLFLFRS